MFLHLVKWIKYCSLIIFVHCCNCLFFYQTLKIAVSLKTLMTRTPTVDQGLVVTLNSTHLTHFRNLPGGDKQSMSDLESTPPPPSPVENSTQWRRWLFCCVSWGPLQPSLARSTLIVSSRQLVWRMSSNTSNRPVT